jgi:hypothetical protein
VLELTAALSAQQTFFGGRRLGNIMSAIFKKAKLIICINVAMGANKMWPFFGGCRRGNISVDILW